ncbi:RcnB family protein [Massilia luteola]|uniref:RcnB family protein n=1 Tax=Massilia luteola TaxID=3081751 RepID=UPI002ACBEB14|nr:RcnB family protein [Massilia sp. Gc5]
MNKKHLAMSTLLAALLSAAGASSFAQDRYHGDRDDSRRADGPYSQRDHDRGDRGDHRADDRYDRRGDDRYDRRNDDRHDGYQARGGGRYGDEGHGGDRRWDGAGPNHDIRRGGHLPSRYRNHQYVVDNWHDHNLRPPPRGYHWVQTGGDYVLAAIATGVIADLIINH